ncbi:MAG TPA: hypothetical protein VIX35_03980, partial [Vicinamibacterales bacterium]
IAVDAFAMLWLAMRLNVWVDEAYTLHTASSGFRYALHQAVFWELQPPVYFLLIAALRHVTTSILLARCFSIACVTGALWTAAAISRRFWPDQHPGWLVLALAANPFVVSIAVEIRVYALVFLLSALLIYLFLEGYVVTGPWSAYARIAFVVVAIIALYTQYYTGFLLPAFAFVLLALRRTPQLIPYLRGMAVVAACAVPILFVLRYQIAAHSVMTIGASSPLAALVNESKALMGGVLALDWLSRPTRWAIALACAFATIGLWFARGRGVVKPTARAVIPFVVLASGGVLFAVVLGVVHQPVTLRYSTALLLPAALCVYAAFAFLPSRPRLISIAVWTALSLATSAASLAASYKEMANIGDWIRVASYIQAHEHAGEPIVTFEPQAALPLALYYRGPNAIVPLPRPIDLRRYDLRESALRSTRDVSDVFERLPSARGEVWLVTTAFCRRVPINFRCELLDQYVATHYDVRSDQEFYWSRVRLLHRVP